MALDGHKVGVTDADLDRAAFLAGVAEAAGDGVAERRDAGLQFGLADEVVAEGHAVADGLRDTLLVPGADRTALEAVDVSVERVSGLSEDAVERLLIVLDEVSAGPDVVRVQDLHGLLSDEDE